jgi:hypothetical protein
MTKYWIKVNKKLNILKCLNITNSRSKSGKTSAIIVFSFLTPSKIISVSHFLFKLLTYKQTLITDLQN